MSNNFNSKAKKYAYLILSIFCVATISLVVVLSAIASSNNNNITDPTNTTTITFANPLETLTVIKGYSSTELQYSNTLKQWQAHKAIDFSAELGTNVFAVYDGTVTDISTTYLMGTTITIDHGNNLQTVYASLSETVNVEEGQTVKKGDIIGTVANTAQSESADGAHLHFETIKDSAKIDPGTYLMLEDK